MGYYSTVFKAAARDTILKFEEPRLLLPSVLLAVLPPIVEWLLGRHVSWDSFAVSVGIVALLSLPVFIFELGKHSLQQRWVLSSGLPFDDAVLHFTDKQLNAQIAELEIQAKSEPSSHIRYLTAGVDPMERLSELKAARLEQFYRMLSTGEIRATETISGGKRISISAFEWSSRTKGRSAMRGLTFSKGN